MSVHLSSGKSDFSIDPPVLNAPGFIGFGNEHNSLLDKSLLGASVTNPISGQLRRAAQLPRRLNFPGGFLLHNGHPNPGLRRVIRTCHRHWADPNRSWIVHLLGHNPQQTARSVRMIEQLEIPLAIQLGLSRLPADAVWDRIVAASGELPLIVQLAFESDHDCVLAAAEANPAAIAMAAPRGTCMHKESTVQGRMYGPAMKPLVLQRAAEWVEMLNIPLFAGAGVTSHQDISDFLQVGVAAVLVDSILWTQPERLHPPPLS